MEPLTILFGGIIIAIVDKMLNDEQRPIAKKKLRSAPQRTGKVGGSRIVCEKVAAPTPPPQKTVKSSNAEPTATVGQAPKEKMTDPTRPVPWKDRAAQVGDDVTVQKQVTIPKNAWVRVHEDELSTYSTIPPGTKGRILEENKNTNELLVEFILNDGRPWKAWLKRNLLNGSMISF